MSDAPGTGLDSQRLRVMLDAVRLLNSTLELKELTGIILEVVRAEVPVERVSVFVVDRGRNVLQSLIAQDVVGDKISLPIGTGIAGTVAATGEVLDIPDAYADDRFDRRFDGRFGFYTNDLFALPVCNRRGEIVGVLELLNRLRPITASDREFLLGISVYIGLALENAWLYSHVLTKERLEQELTGSRERLAETGRLSEAFREVNDEIQNPLTFAMGYLELARDQHELRGPVRTYLEQVTRSINQTAAAARRFQEFVEQRKEIVPMHLGDALKDLSEMRSQEWDRNNIKTTLILESVPPVLVREDEMRLVLLYLIKHAEDSVLQSKSNRELRIHLGRGDQCVQVLIRDSGPGIVPDLQPRLFDPFFNTKPGTTGTGLGLAIANSIVEQHNGQIRFQSERGKGTTFVIELPAAE